MKAKFPKFRSDLDQHIDLKDSLYKYQLLNQLIIGTEQDSLKIRVKVQANLSDMVATIATILQNSLSNL